ncbi:MAG: dTMP kinase [Chloroflexota bacterium]|nr:dTMP kinase [Chloroflexota bacterium]
MSRGLFVSLEGGEASGKSLQARALEASLRGAGHEVVLTREPGGTATGERVREIVLHAAELRPYAETQVLLFSAARAQLVREVIDPALARGAVVISDRFYDSTTVYQGYGHQADLDGIAAVTRFAVGGVRPDRTFLLDVPVEVALRRSDDRAAGRQWDRFESGDIDFHQRLRDGYLRLANAEPQRFVVLDGDRAAAEIAAEIRGEVERVLARRRAYTPRAT